MCFKRLRNKKVITPNINVKYDRAGIDYKYSTTGEDYDYDTMDNEEESCQDGAGGQCL